VEKDPLGTVCYNFCKQASSKCKYAHMEHLEYNHNLLCINTNSLNSRHVLSPISRSETHLRQVSQFHRLVGDFSHPVCCVVFAGADVGARSCRMSAGALAQQAASSPGAAASAARAQEAGQEAQKEKGSSADEADPEGLRQLQEMLHRKGNKQNTNRYKK